MFVLKLFDFVKMLKFGVDKLFNAVLQDVEEIVSQGFTGCFLCGQLVCPGFTV